MNHNNFSILGSHSALYVLRDYLITHKFYRFVDPKEVTDLVFVGAEFSNDNAAHELPLLLNSISGLPKETHVIVLTPSYVYGDSVDHQSIDEHHPIVYPGVGNLHVLSSLCVEDLCIQNFSKVLVLRTFPIYGDNINSSVSNMISSYRTAGYIEVAYPGYQVSTYLYITDFLVAIDKIINKLGKGFSGMYNIGGTERVSTNKVAESIIHLIPSTNAQDNPIFFTNQTVPWFHVTSILRLQALTKWKPKITLRKGLFLLREDNHGSY